MKRFQSILCASLLAIALAPTAFAKSGNITVSRTGNITVSKAGNITVSKTGNITVSKTGNITVSSADNTASTNVDRFSFDLNNYLFMLMPWVW